jgi:prenyltransferase beta subunit
MLTCYSEKYGGFCKYPDSDYPDILHTFYSVASLSDLNVKGI